MLRVGYVILLPGNAPCGVAYFRVVPLSEFSSEWRGSEKSRKAEEGALRCVAARSCLTPLVDPSGMRYALSGAWGFVASSLRAACCGRRVPCSQLRTALGLTFR